MKEKSKLLTLKNKQNILKFWNRFGDFLLCVNLALNLIPVIYMACANSLLSPIAMVGHVAYYLFSIVACVVHTDVKYKNKILNKVKEIDQEILKIVKTDEDEFNILKEYDQIEQNKKVIRTYECENEKNKQLIKQLIEKNKKHSQNIEKLIKQTANKTKQSSADKNEEPLRVENDDTINFN